MKINYRNKFQREIKVALKVKSFKEFERREEKSTLTNETKENHRIVLTRENISQV